MNLFDKQLAKGEQGEQEIEAYYKQQGCIVQNMTMDKEYWKKDIDLIINGQMIEIKTDTRIADTQNMCFELVSNDNEEMYKPGWFFTSEADVFIIYSPQTKMSYQILSKEIRQLYEQRKDLFKEKCLTFREYRGLDKHSVIAIIPIATVKEYCQNYREVKISV